MVSSIVVCETTLRMHLGLGLGRMISRRSCSHACQLVAWTKFIGCRSISWCVYFLLLFLKVPLPCMTIHADLSELYGTLIFPVKSVVTSLSTLVKEFLPPQMKMPPLNWVHPICPAPLVVTMTIALINITYMNWKHILLENLNRKNSQLPLVIPEKSFGATRALKRSCKALYKR